MLLERAVDAAIMNQIVNHPGVRGDVADAAEGVLDLAAEIAAPGTVCLTGEHGGFLCFRYDAGIYEVHSAVLPSGRGEWAKKAAQEFVNYMFCHTDCVEILTRIPQGHVAATALARTVGFRPQFITPAECLFRGTLVTCTILVLTLQEWFTHVEGMAARGAEFHDWLNSHITGHAHEPDPDHNLVVGVTIEMVLAGQVLKGVVFYNRWATAARHAKISIVNANPVQIQFDAGILTVRDGQISLEAKH